MTVTEAINTIDALKPNAFTQEEKLRWLNEVDGIIKKTIIDTHENGVDWTEHTAEGDTLLAEAPYDSLYIYWLDSRIGYYNKETVAYNNAIAAYNTALSAYSNYYNRTHMPIGQNLKLL